MSNLKETLKNSAVFASVEGADLAELESLFEERKFSSGEVLMTAGETAQYYYLLDEGSLLVAMEEDRAVVLSAAGDFAGLDLISENGHCRSTVTVLGDAVAHVISRDDAMGLIAEDSPVSETIREAWTAYVDQVAPFAKLDNSLECL